MLFNKEEMLGFQKMFYEARQLTSGDDVGYWQKLRDALTESQALKYKTQPNIHNQPVNDYLLQAIQFRELGESLESWNRVADWIGKVKRGEKPKQSELGRASESNVSFVLGIVFRTDYEKMDAWKAKFLGKE